MLTYCELLSCDACVHHSFVHGLECIEIWSCDEHHIRHELRCFQYLQSLERNPRRDVTAKSEKQQFVTLRGFHCKISVIPKLALCSLNVLSLLSRDT